jgi:hypothetical protein
MTTETQDSRRVGIDQLIKDFRSSYGLGFNQHYVGGGNELAEIHAGLVRKFRGEAPLDNTILDHTQLNPFLNIEHLRDGEDTHLWVSYKPKNSMVAQITGFKPLFKNQAALVNALHDKTEFTYFEPSFNEQAYQQSLNQQRRIKLAALAHNYTFTDTPEESLDDFFTGEGSKTFEKQGFVQNHPGLPGYETIFTIPRLNEIRGNYFNYQVTNPLDRGSPMELIGWFYEDQDVLEKTSPLPKRVLTSFNFIGTLGDPSVPQPINKPQGER